VVVREPKLRTGCQSKPVSLASDRELNRYSLLKPAALKPIREMTLETRLLSIGQHRRAETRYGPRRKRRFLVAR